MVAKLVTTHSSSQCDTNSDHDTQGSEHNRAHNWGSALPVPSFALYSHAR